MKAFANIHRVRPDGNFEGWLARITVNPCRNKLKGNRRYKTVLESYHPEPSYTPQFDATFTGAAQRAIAGLDEKLRIPLVLKEIEEKSVDEIARLMDLSRTNVKVRLFRARRKLRTLIRV